MLHECYNVTKIFKGFLSSSNLMQLISSSMFCHLVKKLYSSWGSEIQGISNLMFRVRETHQEAIYCHKDERVIISYSCVHFGSNKLKPIKNHVTTLHIFRKKYSASSTYDP